MRFRLGYMNNHPGSVRLSARSSKARLLYIERERGENNKRQSTGQTRIEITSRPKLPIERELPTVPNMGIPPNHNNAIPDGLIDYIVVRCITNHGPKGDQSDHTRLVALFTQTK